MYGHKACEQSEISIKADGGEGGYGSISGYAATFNHWDLQREKFAPGAFRDSLEDFKQKGFITVQHNYTSLPVATISEAREDDRGLWIEADFHSTAPAQEARTITAERLIRGKSASFSLGYLWLPKDTERTPEGRIIKKARGREASLTNVPINEMATVYGVKALADLQAESVPFDDHQETVQAAVEGFVYRTRDLTELRQKAGRKIAQARRERIRTAIEAFLQGAKDLEEILSETEPPEDQEEAEASAEAMKAFITACLIEDARRKELLRI